MNLLRNTGLLALLAGAALGAGPSAPPPDGSLAIEYAGHSFPKASVGEVVVVASNPPVYMELDREYGVVRLKANPNAFDLLPEDDQSALGLILWGAAHVATDEELSRAPGYAPHKGRTVDVAGERVTWREWKDAGHYYGDCTVHIATGGAERLAVYVNATANTPKRLRALEDKVPTLRVATAADQPPASAKP